jgi:hypothetical protein
MMNAMKNDWVDTFLNVGIWLLFVALLVPAVAVGYEIGRSHAPAHTQPAKTPLVTAAHPSNPTSRAFPAQS